MISFEDLVNMNKKEVAEVFKKGHPIPTDQLGNSIYLGVDLSLPVWVNKILWKTFRKTFYKDPESGVIRGWNVKLKQTGYSFPTVPKTNGNGEELAFGHYHLCEANGKKFPGNWQGAYYLDYGIAGNPFWDLAGLGYCPLVAVNKDSADLLLGWEVFKIGNLFIPLNDYWVLKREGELEKVVKV